jgi:hypothetical protein
MDEYMDGSMSQFFLKSHNFLLERNLTKSVGRDVTLSSLHVSIHPNWFQTLRKTKSIKTQRKEVQEGKNRFKKEHKNLATNFRGKTALFRSLNKVRPFAKFHRRRITRTNISQDSRLETGNYRLGNLILERWDGLEQPS